MDINSASCPLCRDGIGHAMDDKHARRVREMIALLVVLETDHLLRYPHDEKLCLVCKKLEGHLDK